MEVSFFGQNYQSIFFFFSGTLTASCIRGGPLLDVAFVGVRGLFFFLLDYIFM